MKYTTILFCLLFSVMVDAQNWTWKNGPNTVDAFGTYGLQGTASPTNKPGGRSTFVSYKDASGNLWIFGGYGRATTTIVGYLNDLWRYNPTTNEWTWMSGANTRNQIGSYGTKGVAASTNVPGARRYASSWVDASGNFWLHGGFGYATTNVVGRLNDLWKYDVTTNQWTWISGDNVINQIGNYGTIDITSSTNKPGARSRSLTWFDGNNTAYLFGGDGLASVAGAGALNDLWSYNLTTNEWTWIHGNNTIGATDVYGTINVSSPTNTPGGRDAASGWSVGGSTGDLYLFGGLGNSSQLNNDLWKYTITTGEWTWVNGNNITNSAGTYGTILTPNANNKPGARQQATAIQDASGRFWLIGGNGYGESGTGALNDMWTYNPNTNMWAWIKGAKTPDEIGIYGTLGTPAPGNVMSGRYGFATWMHNNEFYVYGGFGQASTATNGYLSDVLTLPNLAFPLPVQLLSLNAEIINQDIALSWSTAMERDNQNFEVMHSLDGKTFETLGTVVSKGNSLEKQDYQFTHSKPNLATTHYYQLKQKDLDGKISMSEVVMVNGQQQGQLQVQAYVNSHQELMVNTTAVKTANFSIYDMNGRCISQHKNIQSTSLAIPVNGWVAGVYIIQVTSGNQQKSVRFVLK